MQAEPVPSVATLGLTDLGLVMVSVYTQSLNRVARMLLVRYRSFGRPLLPPVTIGLRLERSGMGELCNTCPINFFLVKMYPDGKAKEALTVLGSRCSVPMRGSGEWRT